MQGGIMESTEVKIQELKDKLQQVVVYRKQKEIIEEELKATNALLEETSYTCAVMMEEQGVKSVNLEGVGRCEYGQSTYPKVVDAEALFADVRAMGAEALIKETIHAQTLRAFIGERLEQNLPLPKGLETYTKKYVKIKATKEGK